MTVGKSHCNFHLKAKQELYRKGLITSCQAIDCKRKESFFQLTKRTQPPSATSTIQLMKRPLIWYCSALCCCILAAFKHSVKYLIGCWSDESLPPAQIPVKHFRIFYLLCFWNFWNHRHGVVFRHEDVSLRRMLVQCIEEASLWAERIKLDDRFVISAWKTLFSSSSALLICNSKTCYVPLLMYSGGKLSPPLPDFLKEKNST